MAANTDPIFARIADVQFGGIIGGTAVATSDGTGALTAIYQADTTEGGFVDEIRLKPVGTTTGQVLAATVIRIYVSSITGTFTGNTAANTALIAEISVASITTTNTAAQNDLSIPIRKALPPGFRLAASVGTQANATANVGFAVTTFGYKY